MDCDDPQIVVSVLDSPEVIVGDDNDVYLVASVVDSPEVISECDGEPGTLLVQPEDIFEIIITEDNDSQVVISDPVDEVEVVISCERGPAGSGGGSGSGLVYSVQDGPDYQASYVYVGYKESGGAWYIYRRTYAGNIREYADGNSGYSTAWSNRTAQVYS